MAYNITFSPDAWSDFVYWHTTDKKTLTRIYKLLTELQRIGDEERGIGKAEDLRHTDAKSKRIDKENRLVYTVDGDNVIVLSCRGHYDD